MRAFCAILFLFVVASCLAQEEATFNVQKAKVIVTPAMDTLLANRKYHFKIEGIACDKIARLEFDSGSVSLDQTGITISTVNNGKVPIVCPLKIFKAGNGKWEIVHAEYYTIQSSAYSKLKAEEVKFSLQVHGHSKYGLSEMNIQNGDTVEIAYLRDADLLMATCPYAPNTFCGIQVFTVKLIQKGSSKKYTSYKEKLPTAFLADIENAPAGTVIRFENINSFLGGIADVRVLNPITFYLTR